MSPKEEITLHDHLKKLETDFKALWSYYHCMQSLMRSLLKQQRIENVNFDLLFDELKNLEASIEALPDNEIRDRLSEINNLIQRHKYILYQFDEKIPPSLTRRFIEKLEKYDIRFLLYFSQFYLKKSFLNQDDWDKIDLIFTKLFIIPDEKGEYYELREHGQIKHMLSLITKDINMPNYPEAKINEIISEFNAITKEIKKVTDFANFLEWGLLARIRDFKKPLKYLIIQPDVLIALLTLNKTSKNKFISLYRDEINEIGSGIEHIDKIGDTLEGIKEVSSSFATPELPAEEETNKHLQEPFEEVAQVSYHLQERLDKIMQLLTQLSSTKHIEKNLSQIKMDMNEEKDFEIPAFLKPYLEKIQKKLTTIDWNNPLSIISQGEDLKDFQFEPWELEAFQELFIQTNPEPLKSKINKAIFRTTLLRHSISELAENFLNQTKNGTAKQRKEFVSMANAVEAHLDCAALYQDELKKLSDLCKQKEFYMLAKCLNRADKKLERTKTGLWLLHDEYIDDLGLPKDKKGAANVAEAMHPIKIHIDIVPDKKKKK